MTQDLQIRIINPSDVLLDQRAALVTMPGIEGEFGVLPMHAPLIAGLKPGLVKITSAVCNLKYFVWGGIARVTNSGVDIITEFAMDLANVNKNIIFEKISVLKANIIDESEVDKQRQLKEELLKLDSLLTYL